MFGPDYTAGCPSCSAIADGFDGSVVHLANHDVTLCAVSRAPLAKLQAYKRRMGWSFPWASSFDSDFNYDFQAAITEEQWESGAVEYTAPAPSRRRSPMPVTLRWQPASSTAMSRRPSFWWPAQARTCVRCSSRRGGVGRAAGRVDVWGR
jgi:predicted dithiol-disulfide oxidoreductase (DUF899 family)